MFTLSDTGGGLNEKDGENPPPEGKEAQESNLDEETIKMLGDKAVAEEKKVSWHSEVSSRVTQWLKDGLSKEVKADLLTRYPRQGSVNLEAPKLNPEVEASTSDTLKKRDKYFLSDQNIVGSAISALGSSLELTILKNDFTKEDRDKLITYQLHALKLMSETHYQLTKTRKAYIYPGLDKKAKAMLEKEQTNEYLFGANLSEKLKMAKSMEKVGLALKSDSSKKFQPLSRKSSENWRSPFAKNQGQSQMGNKTKFSSSRPFKGQNFKQQNPRKFQERTRSPEKHQNRQQKP